MCLFRPIYLKVTNWLTLEGLVFWFIELVGWLVGLYFFFFLINPLNIPYLWTVSFPFQRWAIGEGQERRGKPLVLLFVRKS